MTSYTISAYRTTITTVEIEKDSTENGGNRRCHEQLQRQAQDLNECAQLFEEASRWLIIRCRWGGGEPVGEMERRSVLESSEHFRSCCQQLRHLDEQCRCKGTRHIVREPQSEQRREKEQEQITRCARNLPSTCGMSPQRCEIRAIWY